MARSVKPNRSRKSRKPVTIDLEAQAVEEPVNDAPDPADAEPVAFDTLDQGTSASSESANTDPDDFDSRDSQSGPSESAQSSMAAAPPPVARSGNRGSSLTGGLIGGLLALLGGAGLQWSGILPSFGNSTPPTAQVDLGPLQADIDALKTQIATTTEKSTVQVSAVPDAVTDNIAAAQATSQEALSGVQGMQEAISGLSEKVAGIESAVSSGGAGENAGLEALTTRLTSLEASIDEKLANVSTGGDVDLSAALAPMTKKITEFDGMINAFGAKILDVEKTADAKLTALDTRVSGLDAKIDDTASKISEGGSSDTSVAAAIAAAGLKSAIDRGGSFMIELEAYATVAEDASVVDALRDYAAAGVPTVNQLAAQFPSIANQIVATGQGLPDDAGIADRLMASARSLVQVRPVGEVEGETPGAIAARVESRLLEGDLAAAISEFDTLPEAAKARVSEYGNALLARQSVDALVAKALTGAMASTALKAN